MWPPRIPTDAEVATLKQVAAEFKSKHFVNGKYITTTDDRLAHYANLEAHTIWRRVQYDFAPGSTLGWHYHTQGGTIKGGFNTEAACRKHMRNADADSAYWEAYHAGRCV